MEILEEFYLNNKEWLVPALSSFVSAFIGYLTAMFRTRRSRIEQTFDGLNVYDDNDLVWIQGDYKTGAFVPLSQLSIVKKGKNADEKISK